MSNKSNSKKILTKLSTKLSINLPKNNKTISKSETSLKTKQNLDFDKEKLEIEPKIQIIFLPKSKITNYFGIIREMFAFIKTKKRMREIIDKMHENQETFYVGLLVDSLEMGFCEFNITYQLWDEKICYINHLIVKKESRGMGLGTQILDFVMNFAEREKCEGIELRSDLFRKKAHTFYYKKGFGIDCFNFRKNLK